MAKRNSIPTHRQEPPRAPLRAATDSGMVTAYRPAIHRKDPGMLAKIQGMFANAFRHTPASETSEQGSSAASPSAYSYELYSLRYERRAVIDECRRMYDDDPRCRRAVNMYVREAVRKGVIITVDMGGRGVAGQRAKKTQEICSRVEAIVNNKDEGNSKVESWGRMALIEGDLFVQIAVDEDLTEVVGASRMPAASMERNTDDRDQFIDQERAFSNVDVNTNTEIATFPRAVIWHGRWQHVDGDKYGNPEIVAARRFRRLLEMAEEAQIRRRLSRATQRMLWNIGTPDKPGTPEQVEAWKEKNGWVEGLQEQYDPVNVGWDYFGNGLIGGQVLEGDANVHEIDDIKYYEDVYTSAGLPTPPPLYNLQAEAVNRDVLEDLRAQWFLETQTLSEFLAGCIRRIVDTGLMLQDILPETVKYTVHFSESSIETPTDIIERATKLLNNGYGSGNSFTWMPLITWNRAIQMIAEFMDIDDVTAEYQLIQQMMKDYVESPFMAAQRQAAAEAKAAAQNTGSNGPNGSNDGGNKPVGGGKGLNGANNANGSNGAGGNKAMALNGRDVARNSTAKNGGRAARDTAESGIQPLNGAGAARLRTPAGAFTGPGQLASPFWSTYGEPQDDVEY